MALGLCAMPALGAPKVDCDKGQRIGTISGGKGPGTVVVRGTCVENVVITADDVTITTDGVSPATITARDPGKPAILLDGARRVRIDGLIANGIQIGGGTTGVSARRGSSLDLANCTVTGTSQNGVVASFGSTVTIDHCAIGPNGGNGAVAANAGSLVITDSSVDGNAAQGIVATRSSYVRIGQDLDGTSTTRPVTVSGNHGTGVAITDSASGNVVGGTIENSGGENVFVGRGSSGQIGLGANGLSSAVTIRNSSSHGVHVEGANATIAFATVTGNHVNGIIVNNAGSARIGILPGAAAYGSVTITGNGQSGIHEGNGAAVFLGGTTITGNGTDPTGGYGGFGISVAQGAALDMAGNNVITGNAESGITVNKNATAYVGDPLFNLGTTNTITGNGAAGPENGGIEVRVGGTATIRDAIIADNTGAAIQAFDAAIVDLRGSSSATVPATGQTAGAIVRRGSFLSVREGASIVSATHDGIEAGELAEVAIRGANTIVGNGANSYGIACFYTTPMTAPAVALVGNLANVSGTLGSSANCNEFP